MDHSKKNNKLVHLQNAQYKIEKSHFEEFKNKLEYEFFENFQSEHTKKSYRNDINQFISFIGAHFPRILGPDEIERFHIVAYRNFLQKLELAPKTINRKLSALSSYLDFLTEKDLMNHNPCKSVRRPRQEVLTPTKDITDQQVAEILESVDSKSPSAPLHRTVLYLLFATGIRKAELIQLKRKDYRHINGHAVIDITAKGGKQLLKVLHPDCAAVLDDYIRWMSSQGRKLHPQDWLLQPTKNPEDGELNKKLRPSSIDYILKKACQKVGISEKISPHSARATYIGSALENGVDLWKVSQDVGHSSVRTTEIYNKRRQSIQDSPAYQLGFFNKKAKSS